MCRWFRWAVAVVGLGAVLVPLSVVAHSFDVAVVARYSGPRAAEGASLWNGMRVATREADGHPQETSDGHLGGVDAQLVRVDLAAGAAMVAGQLKRFIDSQGVVIAVIGPGAEVMREAWPAELASVVVLADPADGVHWRGAFAAPPIGSDDGERFVTSYREDYGQIPDAVALGGYAAARLIDQAVRSLDGRFDDLGAVRESFAAAGR